MISLAANNRLVKIGLPFIALCVLFSLVLTIIIKQYLNFPVFLSLLVLVAISILVIFVQYFQAKNIFFDDENMYLAGYKTMVAIRLLKIRKLKLRHNKFQVLLSPWFISYKIAYLNSAHDLTEVTFYCPMGSKALKDFEQKVKDINPYFKVEHWYVNDL